ncbi:RecX family transcriptional regulator [Clostridiaceae bacterium HSG29]|nr:RecX family transcriptional regulator [Clostridiaceae bacterium HSG29]
MSNIITKMEEQKKNKNRISIFIDNEFSFGVYHKTVFKFDLFVGKELTKELIDEIKMDDEYNKCFNKALNYISYQDRTIKEVKDKLYSNEYLDSTINNVIKELLKLHYIDDFEYAKRYIGYKIKETGKYKIKNKLIEKGIDENIIEELLMDYSEDEEYESAYKIANKKNSQYGDIDYKKRYSRLSGFLNRKGYSYQTIYRVMSDILDDYKNGENDF